MVKAPDFVSDIGKRARDLIYKGYECPFILNFAGSDSSGENATVSCGTITGSSFSLATNARLRKKNITTDVNVDTSSGPSASIAFDKIVPGLKTIFCFNPKDENSGQMELRYDHDEYSKISTTLELASNPQVNFSGLVTRKIDRRTCFSVATDVLLNTATNQFTKYDVGCEVSDVDTRISLLFKDKLSIFTTSGSFNLDPDTLFYVDVNYYMGLRLSVDFNLGFQHTLFPGAVCKTQVGVRPPYVVLGASVSHEWGPKCRITVNGDIHAGPTNLGPTNLGLCLSFMS